MKGKIQPFKSKGQISKGERPWLRGPGETWRDRNLQFYHHGKHPISSMQSHSLLLSTHILPPHQDSRDLRARTPCSPVFRLGKGQFHSYLPKHLAPFPHVKPGSAQAWDSCQAVEVYLAWKAFLGIQGRSSLYAEFQGKLKGLSLWEGCPGKYGGESGRGRVSPAPRDSKESEL